MLAPAGAIIPLDGRTSGNDCGNPESLEILIYKGNGSFKLYEDDGETLAYKDGRHTTRHVELFKVGSGYIADTPGFSSLDFETNDLIKKDELAFCFPDFADYIGSCRFSTCAHVNDKGCSLVEAVKSGDVERTRHESYVTMYNEVKDIKDWQL